MYYRLKEPWAFRGWKKLPYAIQAQYGENKHTRPLFLQKAPFLDLLRCDGQKSLNLEDCSLEGRKTINELLTEGYLEQSAEPLPALASWQRYHLFPARYIESAHWSITGKCNFRCRHCLVSAPEARHPQLPLEDCKRIIREMAACGIRRVDITGGEPFVRADFGEIVRELTAWDIDISLIFTNASLLTEQTLELLNASGQHPSFQLSFDGLGHHDWLRGVPGAEAQADAAFRLLQKHEIPVMAAMCIHRGNRDTLRDTANYLASLGVHSLRVNAPQALGEWKQYGKEYALSMDETWDVYRRYIRDYFADGMPLGIEMDGFFSCKKGTVNYTIPYVHHAREDSNWSRLPYCESMRYNLYIGPDGRLIPCMGFGDTALAKKFPNLLEEGLGPLTLSGYYHEVVETKISDLLARNPKCDFCEHLPKCCGGCMVESITDAGDYLVPDERCCYFHKHIGEQAVRDAADAAIRAAGLKTENPVNQ